MSSHIGPLVSAHLRFRHVSRSVNTCTFKKIKVLQTLKNLPIKFQSPVRWIRGHL